jgi:hypothetical protein
MPVLNIPLNDVPDEILPLEEGDYSFVILEAPEIKRAKSDKGDNLVVKVVVDAGEGKKRTITDSIYLPTEFGQVAVRRLIKSCGLEPTNNFNTADLVGQSGKAHITIRAFQPSEGAELVKMNQVKTYLF